MSSYYQSIEELPVFNWFKIHETKELKYLLKTERKLRKAELSSLPKLWESIYNEYIAKFGFGDQFLKQIKKEKQIALLQIEKIEEEDDSIETLIDIANVELGRIKNKNIDAKQTIYELKAIMERQLGFVINIKQCTVIEFYTYLKMIDKNAKQK